MEKETTRNASNPEQVKAAGSRDKRLREIELNDLRHVLQSDQGRRFMWRVLSHCRVFESIWHNSALIHHNAGRQDVGHYLMAEIVEADENLFLQMMKESKKEN